MTVAWPAVALVVGSAVAGVLAILSVGSAPSALLKENHAGRRVPAVLGLALVGGLVVGALGAGLGARARFGDLEWVLLIGVVALAAGGLADDLSAGGPRGLREHAGSLLRGHPTTGILKLVLGLAAAITISALIGGGAVRVAAGALLVAVSVNLWNALDVVPGRSLKWALVALIPLFALTREQGYGLVSAAALGAAVGVMPVDLTERGMLGDAGSNPLGLVVGTGLLLILPTPALVAAAAIALVLQVVAETVTISRLIEATPPLRWFDRLGRRP